MNGSPSSSQSSAEGVKPRTKKLVLCFDGTGNTFSGTDSDTNVVKLLSKLDRNNNDQFHYYQTGIGTYDINAASVNQTFLGGLRSSFMKTIDQGVGTTFDHHVRAGYRFLMQYYEPGAKIYIFGFSRGAYTAKFLARMVNKVGLLCRGNEEMVPFAYQLYQNYLLGKKDPLKPEPADEEIFSQKEVESRQNMRKARASHIDACVTCAHAEKDHKDLCTNRRAELEQERLDDSAYTELRAFSRTFCRRDPKPPSKPSDVVQSDGTRAAPNTKNKKDEEFNVKVYFLGMWDCVSSVSVLEQSAYKVAHEDFTATHIRHAVAIDEHRVKFKASLLAQESKQFANNTKHKEVWFPGSHCDVGGGWYANDPYEHNHTEPSRFWRYWRGVKYFWSGSSQPFHSKKLQMSDIPLAWMIHELEVIGKQDEAAGLQWRRKTVHAFWHKFRNQIDEAKNAIMHNPLRFSSGTAFYKVLMWKFLEYFPFIIRLELINGEWKDVRLPLNKGNSRDIPLVAEFHESVHWRLDTGKYNPPNNHGSAAKDASICVRKENLVKVKECIDPWHHEIYKFDQAYVDRVSPTEKDKTV